MTENTTKTGRRAGGRKARKALRAAPLSEALRPIHPGLEGGLYNPIKPSDLDLIHAAALEILEHIGLCDAPETGVRILTAAGALAGADGRIRFPPSLVEDTLKIAARDMFLFARDPARDLLLSGNRVHYGTAGAAVHLVDPEKREYRDSTLQDLFNAARIADSLDNVHFLQRPMVCRDVSDNFDMDMNTLYAGCRGTAKHVGTSFTEKSYVAEAFKMLHCIAGSEAAWRARPFVSNSCCFVVPPMKFATESCGVLEECVKGGMPVLLLSAGQAGATAPASIAGAVVQAVAECLAGLVYVNALRPGHPAIFGTWPFVSDLRTGAMSGGSGEQALLSAGCGQMARYYGLPGGAAAGIADSKLPDMQAGWEQAISNVMTGLSGLNLVYESVGMHASLLGFCLESMILGNDLLGQCLRCVRGIEVDRKNLALDTIRNVCLEGPGHYLGHAHTLQVMQSHYVYPQLANRMSPKEWNEAERPDLIEQTIERKHALLSQHHPKFSAAVDGAIRKHFNIYLPA